MHLHLSKSGIATCYTSQCKPVISDFQEESYFLVDRVIHTGDTVCFATAFKIKPWFKFAGLPT